MIGEYLKYLLSILNSKIGRWYFEQISTSSGMGTSRWKKYKIEQFPIKRATSDQKKASIQIVDHILTITSAPDYLDSPEKQARVKTLEEEIDQLVYKLYDLTPEEIAIVENFNNGK